MLLVIKDKYMRIKVTDTFKKIGTNDLAEVENRLGISFPEPYKVFIKKYNGGRITPKYFKTVNNEIESSIQYIFGIIDNENYDIFSNYTKWISKTSLRQLVPIAIDPVGNLIVISCSSATYGSIFLWQHDLVGVHFLIETDFDHFLKNLYEINVEQSELDIAIARQDILYFKNRISNGENILNIKNEFNQSVVTVAALYNKVELLKYFNAIGTPLSKALVNAAGNGRLEAVQFLLSIGIDPDERDEEQNNDTALLQAAFGGHLKVVVELIKRGADINAEDINGNSVITKAHWSGNPEVVEILEKFGAK